MNKAKFLGKSEKDYQKIALQSVNGKLKSYKVPSGILQKSLQKQFL